MLEALEVGYTPDELVSPVIGYLKDPSRIRRFISAFDGRLLVGFKLEGVGWVDAFAGLEVDEERPWV